MNRAHAQLPRAFQIQLPVVDEQAFVGIALGHFERQLVDALFGLSDAQIAGTEKRLEFAPQIELVDPAFIQFQRLVVDGGLQIFSGGGHVGQNRARFREFRRLRENEIREFFPRETSLAVENGALKVGIERDAPGFKRGAGQFVPVLKFFPVDAELLGRRGARARGPSRSTGLRRPHPKTAP